MRCPAAEKAESEPSRRHAFETDGEPARGALPPAGPPHPRQARHPQGHVPHGGTSSAERAAPRPWRTAPPGPAGWGRLPDEVRGRLVDRAPEQPERSPRERAVRFTDEQECLVSEG